MKILTALLLVSLPAAARAGCMGGGDCMASGGHVVVLLYAALAVLGYWILQHAVKEAVNFVKRTGIALGMTLIVIGLLGVLCGVGSHISGGTRGGCPERGMMMRGCPEGRMGKMGEMPKPVEKMKAPEPAKVKASEPAKVKASEPVKKKVK